MNLNDKIKQILLDKNLTPSYFADEVGIQRSSMSHILAGRNKPSLDIVQKIIKRFPDLGMEWIMDDYVKPAPSPEVPIALQIEHILNTEKTAPPVSEEKTSQQKGPPASSENPRQLPVKSEEKTIERVMFFYSDGTFKAYKSEN
jgi:DNA-binding XRE family transcriptional regulator